MRVSRLRYEASTVGCEAHDGIVIAHQEANVVRAIQRCHARTEVSGRMGAKREVIAGVACMARAFEAGR